MVQTGEAIFNYPCEIKSQHHEKRSQILRKAVKMKNSTADALTEYQKVSTEGRSFLEVGMQICSALLKCMKLPAKCMMLHQKK